MDGDRDDDSVRAAVCVAVCDGTPLLYVSRSDGRSVGGVNDEPSQNTTLFGLPVLDATRKHMHKQATAHTQINYMKLRARTQYPHTQAHPHTLRPQHPHTPSKH